MIWGYHYFRKHPYNETFFYYCEFSNLRFLWNYQKFRSVDIYADSENGGDQGFEDTSGSLTICNDTSILLWTSTRVFLTSPSTIYGNKTSEGLGSQCLLWRVRVPGVWPKGMMIQRHGVSVHFSPARYKDQK